MKLRSVPPESIQVPETRVTSWFDSEALEMFRESIKALGIIEPPVCMETEEGLILVDGLHRVVEAIQNKTRRIQIVVMPGDMKQALLKNVALNNLRGSTRPTQMARVFQELLEEHSMGTDEIASETGFSRDYVEKLLWISRATPAVLSALDDGLIKVGHAYALARIPVVDVQNAVLAQQLMYRWTIKDLEEHIKSVLDLKRQMVEQPPPAEAKEAPRFRCHFCGGEYEASMIQNPNTCATCAGILLGAHQAASAEALQSAQSVDEAGGGAEEEQRPPTIEPEASREG